MNREEFENKYVVPLTFDNPIKLGELLLHPVLLKDYYTFMMYSEILMIKKDRIPDAKIISMSYMEYLCSLLLEENELKLEEKTRTIQLLGLFNLILREKVTNFGIKKDKFDRLIFYINDFEFTHKLFDDFKDIVLLQNLPLYRSMDLNPILEEELKRADEIRNGNSKSVSFEKRMVSACVNTGMSLEDVENMTLRKFILLENMKEKEIMYCIQTSASMSGFVKFNSNVLHYLQENNNDPLEGKLIGYESLKTKLNH